MARVSADQVREIADLARLRLTEEEAQLFSAQLASILDHIEELEEVTDGVAEEPAPVVSAPLAADEPGPDPLARPPSALAPAFHAPFFTVPRLAAMQGGEEATP